MKKYFILMPLIIVAPILVVIIMTGNFRMRYGISRHEMWE